MPKQLDQLPADVTSLAREVAALKRQMTELRAARRMRSATVGDLKLYAADGTTLLAELGPTDDGGGGLETYGNLGINEIPVVATLTSGELNFGPAVPQVSDVLARLSYDVLPDTGTDLQLSSGSIKETDWAGILDLSSSAGGSVPYLQLSGFREVDGTGDSGPCNFDMDGVFTTTNWAMGTVTITPSAANTPTSSVVSGLSLRGSTFYAFAAAQTAAPGSNVTGVGTTAVTASGLTVWVTRTNTTATVVNWMVIGI
ncbi:hypothetical protein ACIRU8_10460 [Streptomyces sp. NPDC101175]|uniref:hypothetical protein n=1 Tax=Streptomyces sp. NPDC101175 TaxID=3366123 RepID=UPI0038396468